MELNDWSTHMMQAQVQAKAAEHRLLHKEYDKVVPHIQAAKAALDKTIAWVTGQGANAGVDILPMLDKTLSSMSDEDPSKPYLVAAMQEIKQLRGERQFWLTSGYEIGRNEQPDQP